MYNRGSLEERFWPRVRKTRSCWLWIGAKVKGGYGNLGGGGQAHRLSWKIHNGTIPDNLCVLHKCDNPACVRPSHLFLGTNADNVRDRTLKKRHWANQRPNEFREHAKKAAAATPRMRGIKNGNARLSWDVVRIIRNSCESARKLSQQLGVSVQAICNVRNGKTWISP